MPKPTKWIKGLVLVVGTALLFWLTNRSAVPVRKTSFGENAFHSITHYLEKFLNAQLPYTFSQPGTDGVTGWSHLASNRWELRGFILNSYTNQQIPWRAIVRDQRTNAGVLYLEMDGRVLRRASNQVLNLPEHGR